MTPKYITCYYRRGDGFIGTRTVRGRKELCVCVGRFPSRSDRRAEQLKEKVINLDRRKFTGRVEVVKLD